MLSACSVPIKFIAGFKRIKAITKDLSVIAAALSASPQLLVSEDAKRVRRVEPLPEFDIAEVQRRTVLAEHLPDGPTIGECAQLHRMCSECVESIAAANVL